MSLNLLPQLLVVLGIWILFLVAAYFLRAWWAWLIWAITTLVFFRWLRLIGRFAACTYEVIAFPQPGYLTASHHIVDAMLVDGWYTLHIHGTWPTRPVLYAVNYPADGVEYLFFGIVDQYSGLPLSVVSRPFQKNARMVGTQFPTTRYAMYMEAMFEEGINHITVPYQGNSFDHVRSEIQKHVLTRKRSVYFYGNRGRDPYDIGTFRTGTFKIASEFRIPVVPLVFSHLDRVMGPGKIQLWIGDECVSDNHDTIIAHCREFQHRYLRP